MDDKQQTPGPEPSPSPPSESSPSAPRRPFWEEPERLTAVLIAGALRFVDKLDQTETTVVLLAAIGVQGFLAWRQLRRAGK